MQHDQHHQHDDQLVHELGGSSTSSHHLQHSEESASEHKPKNDVRGMTMPIRACRILSTILDSTAIKQLCLSLNVTLPRVLSDRSSQMLGLFGAVLPQKSWKRAFPTSFVRHACIRCTRVHLGSTP